jgi:hypothetical protein
MKKAILALLSATLLLSVISPAQAEDQRVLAIIDTAIDSSKHPLVIGEACFTSAPITSCSNGKTFMEGKGSASSAWPVSINSNTYHGDSMVKAAIASNPNLKIVFVRIADVDRVGNNFIQAPSLISAIKWVADNSEKYSIDAVSLSLSGLNPANCSNQTTITSVASLGLKNIPTFAATGNDASKTAVGFPACVPGVIGVGALSSLESKMLETATNRGPGLDVVSNGSINITKYNGSPTTLSGSSGANVVTASTYIKNVNSKKFQEYLDSLPKIVVTQMDRVTKKIDPTFNLTVMYSSN